MKISGSDYLLLRFATVAAPLLRWLGDVETSMLENELKAVPITKPVFVTGLARAGTTILLERLAAIKGVATHRYRDFPFLLTPYVWNRFLDMAAGQQAPVERAHRDRIQVTAESPEAFEEPIWRYFFPQAHAAGAEHLLDPQARRPRFDRFYRDHIRKIMRIRGGRRYVSKGNYNLTRIEYLLELFPDARFVIPIRHPVTHVHSLVRMHQLFSEYAKADSRVPKYLAASGHFEFGPQRVPIRIAADNRAAEAWARADEYSGYAAQWAAVYRYVDELRRREDRVAASMLVVRYEDFCADPPRLFRSILEHAELDPPSADQVPLSDISPSHAAPVSDQQRSAIWSEAEVVAGCFGYSGPVSTRQV